LNQSYFTNRQDRYLRFTNQPRLAQYCFSFLEIVGTFSHRILLNPAAPSSKQYDIYWPESHVDSSHVQSKADGLSTFQATCLTEQRVTSSKNDDDVLVFPVIQAGQFGIREEEQCLSLLFKHLASQTISSTFKPLLDLTSGYFGLYSPYQDLILNSSVDCRIIAASPKVCHHFQHKRQRMLTVDYRQTDSLDLRESQAGFQKAIRSWNSDL
jgi:CDP-diacylglycerol--glycerol-3-phosphate 3-phosphatidyltransferase